MYLWVFPAPAAIGTLHRVRASNQIQYAIYGVFDLAYHGATGPIPIQEVGNRQGIPARYLEHIFQRLRRAGLIRARRGPGGGYQLGRPAGDITLADVIEAVQGDLLARPALPEAPSGAPTFIWGELAGDLRHSLSRHTIADLCRQAAEQGVERRAAEPASYQI